MEQQREPFFGDGEVILPIDIVNKIRDLKYDTSILNIDLRSFSSDLTDQYINTISSKIKIEVNKKYLYINMGGTGREFGCGEPFDYICRFEINEQGKILGIDYETYNKDDCKLRQVFAKLSDFEIFRSLKTKFNIGDYEKDLVSDGFTVSRKTDFIELLKMFPDEISGVLLCREETLQLQNNQPTGNEPLFMRDRRIFKEKIKDLEKVSPEIDYSRTNEIDFIKMLLASDDDICVVLDKKYKSSETWVSLLNHIPGNSLETDSSQMILIDQKMKSILKIQLKLLELLNQDIHFSVYSEYAFTIKPSCRSMGLEMTIPYEGKDILMKGISMITYHYDSGLINIRWFNEKKFPERNILLKYNETGELEPIKLSGSIVYSRIIIGDSVFGVDFLNSKSDLGDIITSKGGESLDLMGGRNINYSSMLFDLKTMEHIHIEGVDFITKLWGGWEGDIFYLFDKDENVILIDGKAKKQIKLPDQLHDFKIKKVEYEYINSKDNSGKLLRYAYLSCKDSKNRIIIYDINKGVFLQFDNKYITKGVKYPNNSIDYCSVKEDGSRLGMFFKRGDVLILFKRGDDGNYIKTNFEVKEITPYIIILKGDNGKWFFPESIENNNLTPKGIEAGTNIYSEFDELVCFLPTTSGNPANNVCLFKINGKYIIIDSHYNVLTTKKGHLFDDVSIDEDSRSFTVIINGKKIKAHHYYSFEILTK